MDIRIFTKKTIKEKRQPITDEYIWRKERSGRNKAIDEEAQVYFKSDEENAF